MIDILCDCGKPSIFQITNTRGESRFFCIDCFIKMTTIIAINYDKSLKDLLDTIRRLN